MKPEHQQRLLSVAQEISFAKALSSNDKSLRDRALRRLKKWFLAKSDNSNNFTEDGFMRIWKGLFYSVWMSDKPLIQEDLVEDVSQLIHCFSNFSDASMFARCFFQAMSQAWFGIDSFRLDKFMMLLRRFLRQCFDYLSRQGWKKRQVTTFSDDLSNSLRMAPTGMNLHIAELYLEELAKIGKGKLKEETVLLCVKPFGRLLSETTDTRLISNITDNIFCYLLRQSDLGIKYQIKFEAWKQFVGVNRFRLIAIFSIVVWVIAPKQHYLGWQLAETGSDQQTHIKRRQITLGFPGGHIDALEEVEQAEDENSVSEDGMDDTETNSELDPRAGRVDVLLPTLAFNAKAIVQMLKQLRTDKETTTKARKAIASIIDRFSKLEAGEFPLGVKKVELPGSDDEAEMIDEAAVRLLEMEEDLRGVEEIEDGLVGKKSKRKHKNMSVAEWKRKKWSNEWTVTEEKPIPGGVQPGKAVGHGTWDISDIPDSSSGANLKSGKKKGGDGKGQNNISALSNKTLGSESQRAVSKISPKGKPTGGNSGKLMKGPTGTPSSAKKKRSCGQASNDEGGPPEGETPGGNLNFKSSKFLECSDTKNTPKTESPERSPKTRSEIRRAKRSRNSVSANSPHKATPNAASNLVATHSGASERSPESKSSGHTGGQNFEVSDGTPVAEKSPETPNRTRSGKNKKSEAGVDSAENPSTPSLKTGKRGGRQAPSADQNGTKPLGDKVSTEELEGAQDGKKKKGLRQGGQSLENGGWGKSEWDEPLKDGEVEIFIPSKKHSKAKLLSSDFDSPASSVRPASRTTPTNPPSLSVGGTPGSAKKVAFVLNRNTAQEAIEYKLALKQKPSIPYDAAKKPAQGVLKPSAVVSPINPFYRNIVKPFSVKL